MTRNKTEAEGAQGYSVMYDVCMNDTQPGGNGMTKEDWQQLESLCRKALDEATPELQHHPLFEAVRSTGAFAASVIHHMEEDNTAL